MMAERKHPYALPNTNTPADLLQSWHIPRPTLARSSNSSQGSTSSSTNSTQSARSGSLLLTAANLAHIHKATTSTTPIATLTTTREENIKYYLQSTQAHLHHHHHPTQDADGDNVPSTVCHKMANVNGLEEYKKPDPDSVSLASSMHFTVVNVNSRPQIRTRSFCKKHQLSVLIVTMSALFTIGIIAAVFLLEMRARKMSH